MLLLLRHGDNGSFIIDELVSGLPVLVIDILVDHQIIALWVNLAFDHSLRCCSLFAKLAGHEGGGSMRGFASVERAIHVLSWDHSWLERLVGLPERGLGLLWVLYD